MHARPQPAVVLLAAVFAFAGCNTTQPDQVDTRTASLRIDADALMGSLNCYEAWLDVNGDQIIDSNDAFQFLQCEPVLDANGHPLPPARHPVPWHYSLNISIIRAGTTNEVTAISTTGTVGSSVIPGDGIDDVISLTPYDPTVGPAPAKAPQGNLYFINGKQISLGTHTYLDSIGVDLGPENMLGNESSTFDFTLNTGDTVIVRARKQKIEAAPPFLPPDPDPQLKIQATLSVGGVPVTPAGNAVSTGDDQSGISFSFTAH